MMRFFTDFNSSMAEASDFLPVESKTRWARGVVFQEAVISASTASTERSTAIKSVAG
jgi:hypothetical protein